MKTELESAGDVVAKVAELESEDFNAEQEASGKKV